MELNTCKNKINSYWKKENVQPLIVDVQNKNDLEDIKTHYNVGDTKFIDASDYANNDEIPLPERIINEITHSSIPLFVTGLSSFLKLYGEKDANLILKTLINLNTRTNVVILTYQCKKYLNYKDPRISLRILIVDGISDPMPTICLVEKEELIPINYTVFYGIDKLEEIIECSSKTEICIVTSKTKENFKKSLYIFSEIKHPYEAICNYDPSSKILKSNYGTEEQWNYALTLMKKYGCWVNLVDDIFAGHSSLILSIDTFQSFDDNKKWLLFIALKLYGVDNNTYLQSALDRSSSIKELISNITRAILNYSPKDQCFNEYYEARKHLLSVLDKDPKELDTYCKLVRGNKDADALFYLTDSTSQEKELMFEIMDKYSEFYSRNDLLAVFKQIYPDLAHYLAPYQFNDPLLTKYFNDYKYQKMINRITPEFYQIVEDQAEKRDFYRILQPRSSIIETLNRESSYLYFVDALGVEYLSFILSECKEIGLTAKVHICHSELPSITSLNKEFECLFDESRRVSPKQLDEIKHHGVDNRDYQHTKLPIHLMAELSVIRDILQSIRDKLSKGDIETAIMISDHGASRLAVISESESIWSMSTKGKYSGRCCLKTEVDKCPTCATDANDFWALANYDRFRGSRKADVEVHGGATLEEVIVPIIELSIPKNELEVHIISLDCPNMDFTVTPIITVSFRKKAKFKIFSNEKIDEVYVSIDEKYYPAVEIESNQYLVDVPDMTAAKEYSVDVYSSGYPIAEGLPLIVRKESGGERDLL